MARVGLVIESELSPNLDFDEITLIEEISKSAVGSLYKGYWRATKVAVKLIDRSCLQPSEIEMIAQEIKTLK